MENRIVDIETYKSFGQSFNFAGTLRNEKEFDLFQNVFIRSGEKMYQCIIVGKELPPSDNPEYIYKIELPKELIEKNDRISLTCENIFSTIDEAKESAFKELDNNYNLNKQNIERFFNQYK